MNDLEKAESLAKFMDKMFSQNEGANSTQTMRELNAKLQTAVINLQRMLWQLKTTREFSSYLEFELKTSFPIEVAAELTYTTNGVSVGNYQFLLYGVDVTDKIEEWDKDQLLSKYVDEKRESKRA